MGSCPDSVANDGQQAVVVGAGRDSESIAGPELCLGALLQTLTVEECPCAARSHCCPTSSVRSVRGYGQRMRSNTTS